MKAIVIGTSLSGKTTLIKHLRATTSYNFSELDEELTALNNGDFPLDIEYKHKVLFPIILENLLEKSEVIFFTNAWYFTQKDLDVAKKNGFKIIQLSVNLDTLLLRNKERIKNGYEDMAKYLKDMVQYQKEINDSGVVDYVIDGTLPIEEIAQNLLCAIQKQ